MAPKPSVCIYRPSENVPQMLMNRGERRVGAGAEVRMTILARSLARRGWPVSLVAYDYGQPDEVISEDGVRIVKVASTERIRVPVLGFLGRKLPACIRGFHLADAEIYIVLGPAWYAGVLEHLCRTRGRRLVFWLAHDNDPYVHLPGKTDMRGPMRWLAARGLRGADLVISQTRSQSAAMASVHHRDSPVVPNIWELTAPDSPKASPPEVLWAARYMPHKHPERVLQVAARVPEVSFRMAGGPFSGEQRVLFDEVRQAARSLPNLEVMGLVPFAEMDQHYAKATAFLCTSDSEGFPNTFLQAWNHRTSIVSTFDPDGVLAREGVGIAARDVDELAQGIRLACGPAGRAIGQRGREHLEAEHSVDAVMSRLEPLLLSSVADVKGA